MSTNDADESDHDKLARIPIENLGLSEKTIRLLKRAGFTNVGEIVDSLQIGSAAIIDSTRGYFQAMNTEVKPKLQELGYWPTSK